MPTSNKQRARGKHKAGRKQYTGNKFLITSAEGQLLSKQIDFVQRSFMNIAMGLHNRLNALEPQAVVESGENTPLDPAGNPIVIEPALTAAGDLPTADTLMPVEVPSEPL